jgi:hypothetical protein
MVARSPRPLTGPPLPLTKPGMFCAELQSGATALFQKSESKYWPGVSGVSSEGSGV